MLTRSDQAEARPTLSIARYGRRNWAVMTNAGELLVVALYLKGATAVVNHVTALEEQVHRLKTATEYPR